MSLAEQVFLVATLAIVGACVGSFLNVVIYRLPAGVSLTRPASHWPRCGRAIRTRDNVPVLGWWLLGGGCRDCGLPISARYPMVEAVAAALFLLVGVSRLISLRVTSRAAGVEALLPWLGATMLDAVGV